MRLVRGSLPNATADRDLTRELVRVTETTDAPSLRVWTPPKQIVFGRRDTTTDGYRTARRIATEHGYEPIERSTGGRAVAHTGSTVAFALVSPIESNRSGIEPRYNDAISRLIRALEAVGTTVGRGEPEASFCPGAHSLRHDGKIAGLAQRVRNESALVGGYVIVRSTDETEVSIVLDPIYAALGVPFDPGSVGSVEGANGTADVDAVIDAIATAFADHDEPTVLTAEELHATEAP